jgi:hypothetical protein
MRWKALTVYQTAFRFHYGCAPDSDPDTDYTTTADLGVSAAIKNRFTVLDASSLYCPQTTDYFQYGMTAVATGSGSPDIYMYDCCCSLLVKTAPGFRGVTLGGGPVGRARGAEILIG